MPRAKDCQNWHSVDGFGWAFAMKLLGLTLLFFGLGPIIAEYFGHELAAFAWIDSWGLEASLIIKTAMISFGAAFFLPGERPRREPPAAPPRWFPSRKDAPYPDPVAGLYNRRRG